MAKQLRLTPNETITVLRSEPELFEIEVSYAPNGNPPPAHFHPSQAEHFEIRSGSMTAIVDEVEQTLEAGDTLDIPAGATHQMWNSGDEPADVLWQTRPRLRTEQWFEGIDRIYGLDNLDEDGNPNLAAFLPLLEEYEDVFRLNV